MSGLNGWRGVIKVHERCSLDGGTILLVLASGRRELLPGAHLLRVPAHQGLNWYQRRLKQDADGDVADAFFRECPPQPSRAAPPAGSAPGHHAATSQPLLQVVQALSSLPPERLLLSSY